METLGDKLKQLRRQLTQEELALILQVDRSTLASWEVNRREPDIATLRRLADHFKVSIDWLVGYQPAQSGAKADSTFQEHPDNYQIKAEQTWQKIIATADRYGVAPDTVYQLLELNIKLAQSFKPANGQEQKAE